MPFQSADLPNSPSKYMQSKYADLSTPHDFPKCRPIDLPNNTYAISKCRPTDLSLTVLESKVLTCRPVYPTCLSKVPACRPAHKYICHFSADLPTSLQQYAIKKCRSAYLSATHAFPKCRPVDLPTTTYAITCQPLYHSIFIQKVPTCLKCRSADLPTTSITNLIKKSLCTHKVPTCLPHIPYLILPLAPKI